MHPAGTCICFVRACPKHRMMRKPVRPQYVRTRICVPITFRRYFVTNTTSVRACAHVCAETRDARHAIPKDLSTCVRTCVRAIRLPMLDRDAYVALMIARQWLFLFAPRHRLPGCLSTSSLLLEMRGSVRPLAGISWSLLCDTPCSGVLCRVPVVGFRFSGPFGVFRACFRHAGGCVCLQGFWGVRVGVGLRGFGFWCRFFSCCSARHGSSRLGVRFRVGAVVV